MFYGQMGGKDLLRRKWKGLADFVELVCDGNDITPKLKEHKFHAIVFLNIPRYLDVPYTTCLFSSLVYFIFSSILFYKPTYWLLFR